MNRAKINVNRCERLECQMIPRVLLFDDSLLEDHESVPANGFLQIRRSIDGKKALHGKIFKGHVGFERFKLQSCLLSDGL